MTRTPGVIPLGHTKKRARGGGLQAELPAKPIALGDVLGLQALELHEHDHGLVRVETLAPALGNHATLTSQVLRASGDKALGLRQTIFED
jgi:hypothetical protein